MLTIIIEALKGILSLLRERKEDKKLDFELRRLEREQKSDESLIVRPTLEEVKEHSPTYRQTHKFIARNRSVRCHIDLDHDNVSGVIFALLANFEGKPFDQACAQAAEVSLAIAIDAPEIERFTSLPVERRCRYFEHERVLFLIEESERGTAQVLVLRAKAA